MVRIGTHSGTFHCDEALGCFLLRQTPAFKDADVVRTRDPKVLQDLDIVIDVGGTYDLGAWLQQAALWQPAPAALRLLQHLSRCLRWHMTMFLIHFADANRFDHHQRGFEEIFGHGVQC